MLIRKVILSIIFISILLSLFFGRTTNILANVCPPGSTWTPSCLYRDPSTQVCKTWEWSCAVGNGSLQNYCPAGTYGCNSDTDCCPIGSGSCTSSCPNPSFPYCCNGNCNANPCGGGGGGGGSLNCDSIGVSGVFDSSGNLYAGNSYTVSANYKVLTIPNVLQMEVLPGTSGCNNLSWLGVNSGGDGIYSFPWQPDTTGTFTIFCDVARAGVDECKGWSACNGGGSTTCGGPNAYVQVNVVNPAPAPTCTSASYATPVGQTTENISANGVNNAGNVGFAVAICDNPLANSNCDGSFWDEEDFYGSPNGTTWTASVVFSKFDADYGVHYGTYYVDVYGSPDGINWTADPICSTSFVRSAPAPTCTLSGIPPTILMNQGGTTALTANVSGIANGTVTSVVFSSGNNGVASPGSVSKSGNNYTSTISAPSAGNTTLTVNVMMTGNVIGCHTVLPAVAVTVNSVSAWWQVLDGDLATNGQLNSNVPSGSYFEKPGGGGYPGIPTYVSTNLTSSNVSQTTASTQPWLANSPYSTAKLYDSNYFINAIPSNISVANGTLKKLSGPGISQSDFATLPTAAFGYYWYEYDGGAGDLSSSALSLGNNKVILIVKNANMLINGTIHLTKGSGFFMVVSTRDISVASSVGGAGATPGDIEGIYIADGDFNTCYTGTCTTNSLWIRGTVAAYGKFDNQGVNLQRVLATGSPSEVFEYAPDLAILFPSQLARYPSNWREVAP